MLLARKFWTKKQPTRASGPNNLRFRYGPGLSLVELYRCATVLDFHQLHHIPTTSKVYNL